MPSALVTSERGKALLDKSRQVLKAGNFGFDEVEAPPIIQTIVDARRRSEATKRKHDQITWKEKLDAFKMMGYTPTAKQLEISKDTHQVRVVRAGRRSGKTLHAAHEAAAVMLKKPGSFGWVVGPYFDTTYRCWAMMVEELDKLARQKKIKYLVRSSTPSNMRIVLDNGSVAEGKSAMQGDSLQGVGLDWLVMDEIAQIEGWVFLEIIFPAMVQQQGWAILIGTPLGESWATRAYHEAKLRYDRIKDRHPEDENNELIWTEFLFESWHNTFEFPDGRTDKNILKMEREMTHADFMQQVCARPQRSQFVTYKEFDQDIHARKCPYNPDMKVFLSVDPSTGVNPYAVSVIQDYDEWIEEIDEYYGTGIIAADVVNELRHRPWWPQVEEAIFDDASPNEIKTWQKHPDVHFLCKRANKPGYIQDSIPIVRQWLRDPIIYNRLTEPIRDEIVEQEFPGKTWAEIEYEDHDWVLNRLVTALDDKKDILVECSRIFLDRYHCQNGIAEFLAYGHKKPRKDDRNVSETPIQFRDHILDCIRMWLWKYKRYFGTERAMPVQDPYLNQVA